ncbi:MAG: sigma-70 family RNA polymerase sigma factor [Devosia sp.]
MSTDHETRLAGLLRAALGGDEAAYAEFLRLVAALVRPVARRKLASGGGADPEDVVQETLLAIHLKRHTWREDAPVMPWVYAIARYKIVDVYRRRGGRVEVNIEDLAETLPAQASESVSEREIGKALAGLAAGQRNVVAAISVEGRSIAETARVLGMKETAVRVALHRGLAAIAARFGRSET